MPKAEAYWAQAVGTAYLCRSNNYAIIWGWMQERYDTQD